MASIAMEMETVANGDALAAPDEPPYLEFRDLSKIYATDDGPVRALDGISISQRKREFLSILGPSGCGKSTLLMIAAGLLPASHGQVSVQGQRIGAPRTDVGIVFQNPVLLEWRTALGNIMLQAEARKLDRAAHEFFVVHLTPKRISSRRRSVACCTGQRKGRTRCGRSKASG